MNTIETLNQKIRSGKKYIYHKDVIIIKGFREHSGIFLLTCSKKGNEIIIQKDDIEKVEIFLNSLIEFEDNLPEIETKVLDVQTNLPDRITGKTSEIFQKNKVAFESLSNILLDDINKVREDPKYVPQAKQVANSAQTIVNLVKLQIEILTKG